MSGFVVTCKTTDAASVRLVAGTDDELSTGLSYSDPETPDGDGWARLEVDGLDPDTDYWYAVEMTDADDGTHMGAIAGPVHTLGGRGPSVIAFGSCLQSDSSTATAFTRILARNPDIFCHLGDFHYGDNTSTSQASHLADLEGQLAANSGLRTLMASVPTFPIKSDHDSGGNNGAPGAHTPANRAAYKQCMPHPTLVNPDGLYWSVAWEDVKVIFTDHYYLRTSTSMMGATQRAWFLEQIATPEPVKIWMQASCWTSDEAPEEDGDKWSDYPDDQQALGEDIAANLVGRLIVANGDAHQLSSDDGTNDPTGNNIPSFVAAPFSNTSSQKGGPWSEGRYPTSGSSLVQQYGIIEFTYNADSIDVAFTGYDSSNSARVPLTVTVDTAADPTVPAIVEDADASALTDPTDRAGMGKGQHWQWWNDIAERWDAVLPTATGWRLFTDLLGTPTTGAVVDDRQDTRIDTLWHDGSLWVLRGHDTTPRITRYDYTDGAYVADGDVTDVGIAALAAAGQDASPLLLHRTANGRLWASVANGSNAVVAISDDDGETWSSANVVATTATGVAALADAGGLVVLLVMQNDGDGRAVRTIAQDASSIASGNWATEALPALGAGLTSDDHGMAAGYDGHVYATAKTTGSDSSGETLLYLLDRDPGGTWSMEELRPGPDNQGDTRPVFVPHGDLLYVGYGRNQTPTDGMRVTVPRSTLTPGTPAALLDAEDGRWSDSYAVPREVSGDSGLLWIAHDTDTGLIWRVWEALPYLADSSLGLTLGITATAVKRAAGAAPMNLSLATADTGGKAGEAAADMGVDVTATGEGVKAGAAASGLGVDVSAAGAAEKAGAGAASVGVDLTASGAGAKHAVASAVLDLALAIAAATQLGAEAEIGVGLGITATATKHTSAGAAFDLQLSTSDLAEKAADADAQLTVALGLLGSAVRGGTHQAELGIDLEATASAAKHAAAYATIALGLSVETVAAKQAIADAAFDLAIAVIAAHNSAPPPVTPASRTIYVYAEDRRIVVHAGPQTVEIT